MLHTKQSETERNLERNDSFMSKYNPLWEWIGEHGTDSFTLTFDEIRQIAGLPLDHSFLKYKKELSDYGYEVGKISMKARMVNFIRKKEGCSIEC